MFLLGSLSSLTPYVVMMLAYLFLFVAGGNASNTQIDEASLLASNSDSHIIYEGNSSEISLSTDYQYQYAPLCDVVQSQTQSVTPPDNFVIWEFGCTACLATSKAFIRFSFSLPPPHLQFA